MESIFKEDIREGIFLLHNLLTQDECEAYIRQAEEATFEEATVSLTEGAKMIKGIRNNQRVTFDSQAIATDLWSRIEKYIPTIDNTSPSGLNERIRFYKYESNERFNKHRDGRFNNGQEESRLTFMIYLNDNCEGGETEFDDVSIKPKTGTALCFIHELKHKGCPVQRGVKYVLRSDIMFRQ